MSDPAPSTSGLGAALRVRRNELLALAVLFVGIALLPLVGGKSVPLGIYGRGLVSAAILALHATAIVLVYRSDRFLNFAQLQLGALGGTAFALVVQAEPVFRTVDAICPPCSDGGFPAGAYDLNYVFAVFVGLAVAVGIGLVTYVGVIRRLANASRLVVTVASLFVVQALAGMRDPLVNRVVTVEQRARDIPGGALPPPSDVTVQFGGANFTLPDLFVLGVAVVAIAGLAAYLRFTATGTAIRAASSNRDRAETLGISVDKVAGRVWLIVGAMSGAAAILGVMSAGEEAVSGGLSVPLLVRVLAAVVIARLVSLPMAGVAAIAFGLLDQVVLWVFGSTLPVDGALLLIIGGLLLAQRRDRSRADADDAGSWQSSREMRPIPAVLAALPEIRRFQRVGGTVLAVVLLALPWVMSPSQTNRITTAVVYAVAGLSLLVLTGWGGLVSLGQFAFAGLAAWVVAVSGLPLPVAVVVGPIVGAAIATVVGIPALKLRGVYLGITTLALALATAAVVLNARYLGQYLPDEVDRPRVLGFDLDDQRVSFYFMIAMLLLATWVVSSLRRSRTGRVLIAARDNASAVAQIGVSVVRARVGAFAISGALAGLAGVLFTYQQGGVRPDAFGAELSVQIFVMTVIGGFGSVIGPLLGFSYFALVSLFSSSETVTRLASGFGGLALVLLVPGGLTQLAYGVRDAGLRRVAKRHRLIVPSLIADQKADDVSDHAPLRPKLGAGGGTEFVPQRYTLDGQWLVGPATEAASAPDDDVPALSGVSVGDHDG